MDSTCPIDEKCADVISDLLRPPSPLQVQEYFDELISARHTHGIAVKQNGELGKGVYADMEFADEELILKDQMLVGIQHSSNKVDCLVCSFCFQFIGSIEQQIGRKLYFRDLGVSSGCDNDCCDDDSSVEEDIPYMEYQEDLKNCGTSSSKNASLPEGVVSSLMSGQMNLPHSSKYPLPSPISCPGECREAYYCSESCAKEDWETSHSLLCTGERSHSLSREALGEFVKHANETNDIFLLAAKAISFTILRYKKRKATQLPKKQKSPNHFLLVEAWKPLSFGYKKRWWDCIALPDDVDPSEETMFRNQIRDLAFTSLQLLKAAIFVEDCEPLFSLEIYGHIIGMFELNNLDLVVASPVEDYFLYIDDLPDSKKIEIEEITRPILDVLGEEYSACCEGTAFFPLQSCMNHSCCPNAKAFKREEDRDGQATIIALRPIQKGEEITISYIDEDLPFEERRSLLADYGFSCECTKCLQESRP